MPAWIIAAMRLLAGGAAFAGGTELAQRALGDGGVSFPGFNGLFGGDEKKKRRRRRRALTASDRADIAFIQATLGQAAGKAFAMLVVSRTTA